MALLAISEAFRAAVDDINARCRAQGCDGLGHDVCQIAAYHQFEKSYIRALDRLVDMPPDQQRELEGSFNLQAVASARLWICRAILVPSVVKTAIKQDLQPA